jgi:hypothetical protein
LISYLQNIIKMDYNWLENVPSSVTPIPVYQPDFSFLASMQMKANQQYEQGLKEVKGKYDAIFNQPVTGEEARKRQQDYKNSALEQMKSVAATDLSDPKNVLAAENIMAPFHEDQLLLQNQALTSHYNTQFQKLESMRTSKDEKERELYNPWISTYLNQGLDQLAGAPMTKDAYSKLERREAMPVYNIDTDAAKEWSEIQGKGGGITTVDTNGNLMTIFTNGPKSVNAYKAFYKSVASREKYAPQQRAIAIAQMGQSIKDIKDKNPGVTEEQATRMFGENVVEDVTKYYAGTIADYNKTALEWRKKNNSLVPLDPNGWAIDPANIKLSPEKEQEYEYNLKRAKEYADLAKQTQDGFEKSYGVTIGDNIRYSSNTSDFLKLIDVNSSDYKRKVEDIVTNPRDYVKSISTDHDADRWAVGRASISSVEFKENPIAKAFNEQSNKLFDQQLKIAQFQLGAQQKQTGLDIKLLDELRKSGYPITKELLDQFDLTGEGIGVGGGMLGAATGFGGVGTGGGGGLRGPAMPSIGSGTVTIPGTDVVKTPTLDVHRATQAMSMYTINKTAFGMDGILQMASDNVVVGGLSAPDLQLLSQDLQNSLVTGKYDMSSDAIQRRQKIVKILNDNGLQQYTTDGTQTGPNQLRQGLSALIHQDSTSSFFQTVDTAKTAMIIKIAQQNQEMENEMANYVKRETEYKNRLVEFINNDKTGVYKKLTYKKTNDFYTPQDAAEAFNLPTISISALGNPRNTRTITGDEFAKLWADKNLNLDIGRGTINLDGKEYQVNNINGFRYTSTPATFPVTEPTTRTPYHAVVDLDHVLHGKDPVSFTGAQGKPLPYNNNIKARIQDGHSFYSVFGTPGSYKEKIAKVGQNVVGEMSEYKTGVSGAALTYDMSGEGKDINPIQKATGIIVTKEALIPTNHEKVYTVDDDNKMKDVVSTEVKKALEDNAFTGTITKLIKGTSFHQYGPNGTPAVELVFQDKEKGDDKLEVGGVSYESLKGLKKIWLDISPTAKGSYITQLPQAQMSYRYGQLFYDPNGLEQSDFEKNAGFQYKMLPDQSSKDPVTGRYTRMNMYTMQWELNDDGSIKMENGLPKFEKNWTTTPINLMVGDRAMSPDELYQKKNNWINGELTKRAILQQNHQSKPPTEGGRSVADIEKQFK